MYYQWQENGTNLTDGGGLAGSASRILNLSNVTTASGGMYSVIVSNSYGSISSSNAVLSLDLPPTIEAWRKSVPGRLPLSPVLAAMTSVTGAVTRFMHIWPYKSFDERARLRDKAVADGVWPPPGGPSHLLSQQVDIYLPAPFSPMR